MSKLTLMQQEVYANTASMFLSSTHNLSWWEAYEHIKVLAEEENTSSKSMFEERTFKLVTVTEDFEYWPFSALLEMIENIASSQVQMIEELFNYAKQDMIKSAKDGLFDAFDMHELNLEKHVEEGIKSSLV